MQVLWRVSKVQWRSNIFRRC